MKKYFFTPEKINEMILLIEGKAEHFSKRKRMRLIYYINYVTDEGKGAWTRIVDLEAFRKKASQTENPDVVRTIKEIKNATRKVELKCVVCNESYTQSIAAHRSNKRATCSDKCLDKIRKAQGRSFSKEERADARKSFQESKISGPFETNIHAVEWIVVSPKGVQFEFRNLRNWIRENLDLFKGLTQAQVYRGLSQSKYKEHMFRGWKCL